MKDIRKQISERRQAAEAKIHDRRKQLTQPQRSDKKGVPEQGKTDKFFLAYNALNGKPVYLEEDQLKAHWHVLGGTGKGKSKFLEHIAKTLIEKKQGICIIDPHGSLYAEMVKYIVRNHLEDKTILIDFNEDENLVGLNYLEIFDNEEKSVHDRASLVLRAFMKVFGEVDEAAKPRFERWGRDVLQVLIERGGTLLDAMEFLRLSDDEVRRKITDEIKDDYYRQEWEEFNEYPLREKLSMLEAVYNRLNKFIGHERVRRIVGQVKSTVNFRQAMDEGKIILINLTPRKFSQEIKNMLGVMLIDMIIEAAISRSNIEDEKKRRPFYLMVDEFGEIVCDDFAYALDSCRKFKVWLILAHQRLFQLQKKNYNVYDAVMSLTDIKISFGISRADAEIMAKELFTGKITGDKIKDEIYQTKFWPHETTREIKGESSGESRASGSGHTSNYAHGRHYSQAQMFDPGSGLFFHNMLGLTEASGDSSMSGWGDSRFDSTTTSGGQSSSTVPWYEYEPFKELSSRTFFSPEEVLEKFISWLKNQQQQHAQLKTGTKNPMAIVTPWLEDARPRKSDIEKFIERIKMLYTKPIVLIDQEIKDRRNYIIESAAKQLIEPADFRE